MRKLKARSRWNSPMLSRSSTTETKTTNILQRYLKDTHENWLPLQEPVRLQHAELPPTDGGDYSCNQMNHLWFLLLTAATSSPPIKTLSQTIKDVCAHFQLQITPVIYSYYPVAGLSLLVEYRGDLSEQVSNSCKCF